MAMTHTLRLVILKHIAARPQSGYEIIKAIHSSTGWKPSFGSVYPVLDQLRTQGSIVCREEGKRKVYSITPEGRRELQEFMKHHDKMISSMREIQQVMMHLYDIKGDPFFEHLAQRLERGEVPFKPILKPGYRLRQELARIEQDGIMEERKKEIIAILEDATRKLQAIRPRRQGKPMKAGIASVAAQQRRGR